MARLACQDDDMIEKSSTYSIFGQSMQNFNPNGIPTTPGRIIPGKNLLNDENMDDYVERLL